MGNKSNIINRRTFFWLLGSVLIGFFLFIRYIYSPSKRLQSELEKLGFMVEIEELDKFWDAYLNMSEGKGQHPLRVLRTYIIEPRAQNTSLFLLSSNVFEKKEAESVRFITLYSAYNRPCFHPFLERV